LTTVLLWIGREFHVAYHPSVEQVRRRALHRELMFQKDLLKRERL